MTWEGPIFPLAARWKSAGHSKGTRGTTLSISQFYRCPPRFCSEKSSAVSAMGFRWGHTQRTPWKGQVCPLAPGFCPSDKVLRNLGGQQAQTWPQILSKLLSDQDHTYFPTTSWSTWRINPQPSGTKSQPLVTGLVVTSPSLKISHVFFVLPQFCSREPNRRLDFRLGQFDF